MAVRQAGVATSFLALGLAATVVLCTKPVQAQVSFLTAQTYAVGNNPFSVTVGDLDGDGDLDLATADTSPTVSVLKNNGNGTFAMAQKFTTGNNSRSIVVGDLDGDGDLDLATANFYSDNVYVLKNNGNGTFAAAQNFATGEYPHSIAVGDLDGDGDLDLATANQGTFPGNAGTVSVLKNNGTGTFAAPQNFADFSIGYSSRSITIGDLDGDGDLDLATANSGSDNMSVLKNNGNGTFASPQTFDGGGSAITVGDLDGDGDLDIATANGSASVSKNNGDGTFAASQNFATGYGSRSITVGDLDGDGDLDLATASSYYTTMTVLRNKGNGTFATAQNFAVGDAPRSITVGDLDGDGDLDLATANYLYSNVSVLLSTTPTLQLSTSPNRTSPTPLAGESVSGNIYIFASGKDSDFLRVRFYLDDPDKSDAPIRTEQAAPFDFAGGSVSTATVFDTTTLTNGEHTITATFARTDGTYRTITSTFTVGN